MIAIASDHGGFDLKNAIIDHLRQKGMEVTDYGCFLNEACDYPEYAYIVTDAILSGECDRGILICGTGIGMSMAANRVHGIRAALCTDTFCAQATREHNDANVLCMGGRVLDVKQAIKITDVFLETPFSKDARHIRRINKFDQGFV